MKQVISFSLWGDLPMYCEGAICNALLAQFVYPEWVCRFYYDTTVPAHVIDRLKSMPNVELVQMPVGEGFKRLFWRIVVAADKDVSAYLVRDTDSRLSIREAVAVNEWIRDTSRGFHTIRDNRCHTLHMQGGMWGGRVCIENIDTAILAYCAQAPALPYKDFYFSDQMFLNQVLWKIAENDHVAHIRAKLPQLRHDALDRILQESLGEDRFVGQVYDEFNNPLPETRRNPLI
jgi:hypothetical protein